MLNTKQLIKRTEQRIAELKPLVKNAKKDIVIINTIKTNQILLEVLYARKKSESKLAKFFS